ASAYTGLGEAYQKMDMLPQAEQALLEAVRLAPLDVRPELHLADVYFEERKFDLAEERYQASIRALPSLRGYFGLGITEWERHKPANAERAFKMANALDSRDARAYFMLGLVYSATGRKAEAIREYEAGLRMDPKNRIALNAIAKLGVQTSSAGRPQP
ncbi:MAG: tetratricopeptide repeat protein, partial [Terriglobia bacterium]